MQKIIGHAPGGVCPFGINDGVKVYLDESLKSMDSVLPACGTSDTGVELTIPELEKASCSAGWVDITKSTVKLTQDIFHWGSAATGRADLL